MPGGSLELFTVEKAMTHLGVAVDVPNGIYGFKPTVNAAKKVLLSLVTPMKGKLVDGEREQAQQSETASLQNIGALLLSTKHTHGVPVAALVEKTNSGITGKWVFCPVQKDVMFRIHLAKAIKAGQCLRRLADLCRDFARWPQTATSHGRN
jgi:hypothetical protein